MAGRLSSHGLFGLLVLAAVAPTALGQCAWWDGFRTLPSSKGLSGNVYAMAVWDSDGAGPNPPALYVGGSFTTAGTLTVNSIAKWDGTNWSALGAGIPLTGGYGEVRAMTVWDDGSGPALYVGGQFKFAGGVVANSIAKWNGTAWSALGAGVRELASGVPGYVYALAGYKGKLYIGGYYFGAGPTDTGPSHLGCWSPGGGWETPTPAGIDGEVLGLAVFGGKLYAIGGMHSIGSTATEHIASYDGMTWSGVGGGLTGGGGEALAVCDDGTGVALYAGGHFTAAGGTPASCLARWNGVGWSSVGGGISNTSGPARVYALTAYDDGTGPGLVVGGFFNKAGTISATCVAYYQNGIWSGIGGGAGDAVKAATVFDGDGDDPDPANLFIGGQFSYVGVSGGAILAESSHIARWYDRDSDGDGILDCWETSGRGIDIDHDGKPPYELDLYSRGARVDHKDIFIEVDAMNGIPVDPLAIADVVAIFADAPKELVNNPDDIKGVNLHIDLGTMETDIDSRLWTALDANGWPMSFDLQKQRRFGTPAERMLPKVLAAKRLVYRYCIFAHSYGATTSSGLAEIGSNDFFVTLGGWRVSGGTKDQQAGTFMHELGHTLGLYHGGDQDESTSHRYNFKPNYHSVMNYTWQVPAILLSAPPFTAEEVAYAASWELDYSRKAMTTLDENGKLKEQGGIGGTDAHATHTVPIGPLPFTYVLEGGDVHWNGDPDYDDMNVSRDINLLPNCPASLDVLTGFVDWSNLDYNFRDSGDFSDGVHQSLPTDEMTEEILFKLARRPGGCNVDFDHDLDNDADDIAIFQACATGPGIPYDPNNLPAGCTLQPDSEGTIRADIDRDGDVDQTDFGVLQACLTGSGV